MKRTALILWFSLISLMGNAQPPEGFHPEKLSDDELISMQIKDIVSWLCLDEQTKSKFTKEYTAFRKEIDAVAKGTRPSKEEQSEEEIDKALQKNFEVSEKILQIRKKYYLRFREFLKPSQIKLIYRIENEAGRRMHEGPLSPGGQFPPIGPGNHPAPPMPHPQGATLQ